MNGVVDINRPDLKIVCIEDCVFDENEVGAGVGTEIRTELGAEVGNSKCGTEVDVIEVVEMGLYTLVL